jgi:ABC-type Fe3+/spermidine/putrescine transport system ATPase subunit
MALSRLILPSNGSILYRGKALHRKNDLAYRRKIGLVLQAPYLQDLSVFQNVAAGLNFRGMNRQEIQTRVLHWLERLEIADLKDRRAKTLSGGEAQRVSLARALVLSPDILMMDEPFSALDAPTRLWLLGDLQKLLRGQAITSVFVTHDMNEALLLGDRVAVLNKGRLAQTGRPAEVFSGPVDLDVAALVGVETVIPARVVKQEGNMVHAYAISGEFSFVANGHALVGKDIFLCLRPEEINLVPVNPDKGDNYVQGIIVRIAPQGALWRISMDCGFPFTALVNHEIMDSLGLSPGKIIGARFKANSIHVIDPKRASLN